MKQGMAIIRSVAAQLRTDLGKLRAELAELRKVSAKDPRRGFSINFMLALTVFALITFLTWGFDYVDGLYDRILVTLVAPLFPVSAFIEAVRQKGGGHEFPWITFSFVIMVGLVALMAIGVRENFDAVVLNGAVLYVSFPWLLMVIPMVRQKRILAVGIIPGGIILLLYFTTVIFPESVDLNVALLPLAPVAIIVALWALPLWILFKGVDRWHGRPISGPGIESVAMFFLAAPVVVSAMLVVKASTDNDTMVAIIGVLTSLVFSSAVSVPFREFLRDLGNLSGNDTALEDGEDGQGHGDAADNAHDRQR